MPFDSDGERRRERITRSCGNREALPLHRLWKAEQIGGGKAISQHLCRIRPFALRTDCFPGKTPRLERTGKSRYRPCAVTKAQRSGGTDLALPNLVIQWSSGTVPCCVKRHGFPAGASRRSSSDQLSTTFSCVAADSCSLALIIRNRCPSGQPPAIRRKPRRRIRTWGCRKGLCHSLAIHPEKCALAPIRTSGDVGQ